MKKLLIVYYSWSNGNTKKIAEELQKVTGGDLARIDTKTAYKDQDYQVVVDQAEKDVQRGYEPVLAFLTRSARTLYFLKPAEAFMTYFKVMAVVGLLLAFLSFSMLLFVGGCVFAFEIVLPRTEGRNLRRQSYKNKTLQIWTRTSLMGRPYENNIPYGKIS